MFWFCDATGRFTTVVMNPAEIPVQTDRVGVNAPPLVEVPLYPPVTKLPPADTMSWNAPPAMEISSTPPSHPGSISYECRNVRVAAPAGIAMLGDTSTLWLAVPRFVANARLGAVSGLTALVAQGLDVPDNVLVVHPAGSDGGPTPSKVCDMITTGLPT